ncbi:hypothetical protein [Natrialba sp. INN-245]|uniref:hypothetical protein n=1 Tax=Natrialba sp. INN-245 TaxID=2690967 RepID=UPI001311101D|nr:hypothetical protein [Natrialba sp. INN-245]MWV40728.1 hypothetical protein [Natrialba sp. INN-245]
MIGIESSPNVTDSLSAIRGNRLEFDPSATFTWEIPEYHERRKQSDYILQEAFGDVS